MRYFYPLMRQNSLSELQAKFNPIGVDVELGGVTNEILILTSPKFYNQDFLATVKGDIQLVASTWKFQTVTFKFLHGAKGVDVSFNNSDSMIK